MYRVVHSFYTNQKLAKKQLAQVKKSWPDAFLEEDKDGHYVIVMAKKNTHQAAMEVLHNVFRIGLWCGVEQIED